MDPSIMKNFEIACLHTWERSWLDKMQAVELNPWTSGRLTNPKERTKMSMQCNNTIRLIGPTRNTSKSPTMSETLQPSDCQFVTVSIKPIDSTRQGIEE